MMPLSHLAGAALLSLTFASSAFSQNNQLLRSGTIAQFAETKVYQADGIEVTVGELNNSYFLDSDDLATSLTNAAQATGVIEPGWQTTSHFEEWSDRLILTRTTTYTLLDGNTFEANFAIGAPFESHPNVVNDPEEAPDMLQLATEFIADDGHLDLYPEAQAAGNIGPQALLDELGRNVGPVTFTEILEISRGVPVLEQVSLGHQRPNPLASPAAVGKPLDPAFVAQVPFQFEKAQEFDPVLGDPPVDHSGGIGCYEQEMLNGFTAGHNLYHIQQLGKAATGIKLTFFANYGIGIRIPWEAKVAVEPKLITEVRPDLSPFTSEISLQTHNASPDFYTRVGLPSDEVYDGKEFLLEAGAGVAAKVTVLGKVVLDRPTTNPLIGGVVDMSTHFDPPMNGNSVTLGGTNFLYESTGLAYNGWILAVGSDLRVDAGIAGEGFDLNVGPHNAWNSLGGGGISKSTRSLFIAQENTPSSLPFAVDDDSPKQTTFDGDRYYRHGAVYSDAIYNTDITVTPSVRLRAKLKLSAISRFLSDKNFSTPWKPLTTFRFDGPNIKHHGGTEKTIEAYHLNRRELGPAPAGNITHDFAHNGDNTWTISLLPDCEAQAAQIVEVLNPGQNVIPGSIIGGGVYHPDTHTIVWNFAGETPHDIGYQLAGPVTNRPKPLATWTPQTLNETQTVLPAGSTNLTAAEQAVELHTLAQRPTLEEVIDGRPGSTLLEVDSQNTVRLHFQLDTSENLHQWTTVTDTVANPLEVEFELPADKRFFRFRMN